MNYNNIFSFSLFFACIAYLAWGFIRLPGEDKQFVAVIPGFKQKEGHWEGINFTYYGLIIANSVCLSAFLFLILIAALKIPLQKGLFALISILLVTIPASKWIARWVEKKDSTFTVGGAWFAGSLLSPIIVAVMNFFNGNPETHLEFTPILSAMLIAYCFGEGLGRLACISFGCCYGKPLSQFPDWVQSCFKRFNFKFYGRTKKVVYAENWEGVSLFPIQGVTAIFFVMVGIISLFLFIQRQYFSSMLTSLIATQGWRFFSEFFRSDHLGHQRGWSWYQIFSLISIIYLVSFSLIVRVGAIYPQVNIIQGLHTLWTPWIILFFFALWSAVFIYFGKSKVTGSYLSFSVKTKNI